MIIAWNRRNHLHMWKQRNCTECFHGWDHQNEPANRQSILAAINHTTKVAICTIGKLMAKFISIWRCAATRALREVLLIHHCIKSFLWIYWKTVFCILRSLLHVGSPIVYTNKCTQDQNVIAFSSTNIPLRKKLRGLPPECSWKIMSMTCSARRKHFRLRKFWLKNRSDYFISPLRSRNHQHCNKYD